MERRNSDAIRAEGLRKIFRPARLRRRSQVVALDGIDLTVRPGETFGLIGPDGAGETTTIRLLSCDAPGAWAIWPSNSASTAT